MQLLTHRRNKLVQLGLLMLATLVLITVMLALLSDAGQPTAQAQGIVPQTIDPHAQQSTTHNWIVEVVDQDGGWSPSMVLDQYQRPHIAYKCASGFCYAVFNGTQWVIETISSDSGSEVSLALDAAGHPHVSYNVYGDPYALKYAYSNGSSWTVETVEAIGGSAGTALGRNSALALDAAGHPHITYYGPQPTWDPTDFRHAYHNGSQWVKETIADVACGNGAGVSSGLLVDSAGHLHTLYDGCAPTYAHFDGSTWSTQYIGSGFGGSLAMASDGSLHASFISWPSGSDDWLHLKYASLGGSEWFVQEVMRIETEPVSSLTAPLGFVNPGATALQLDSFGMPHIAFFNATDSSAGYLRYAHFNGSEWTVETVDTQGRPGWARLSLALDPSGYPQIAYLGDWSDQELRYASIERIALDGVSITGPTAAYTDTAYAFTSFISPSDATPPITYTWSPTPESGQGTAGATYRWAATGVHTITLVAENCGGAVNDTHVITTISARTVTTIDPSQGGTLVHTDTQWLPTAIQVPPGVVTESTALVYTAVPAPSQPISPGLRLAGHAFDLETYQKDQPVTVDLKDKVVSLTIRYSDADVSDLIEKTLAPHRWTGNEWEKIGTRQGETYTLDIENNTLTAYLRGFSRFGSMGAAFQRLFLPLVLK